MIEKNMTIGQIVQSHPHSVDILLKYGLHCVGCGVAHWETLEQGASAHGIDDENIDKMLEELNKTNR